MSMPFVRGVCTGVKLIDLSLRWSHRITIVVPGKYNIILSHVLYFP